MCRSLEDVKKEGLEIAYERGYGRVFAEVFAEGFVIGYQQGLEKAKMYNINAIKYLIKNLNFTAKQAMDALMIPAEEQEKYLEKLN